MEIVPHMHIHPDEKYPRIREMAKAAQTMVTEAVDAYVKQDLELARKVMAHDDVVDDYFVRVKKGIIGIIAAEPAHGEYALDLLMIAKYFERIGDHCTNIAEWVEFSVTGIHKDCQKDVKSNFESDRILSGCGLSFYIVKFCKPSMVFINGKIYNVSC